MSVNLSSRWPEIVAGREAWQEWLSVAREEAPDVADYWSDTSGCAGCVHLDRLAIWCDFANLPASYNPILSPKHGMSGMACCGAARTLDPANCDHRWIANPDFRNTDPDARPCYPIEYPSVCELCLTGHPAEELK